ncbi:hypothetical protein BZA77DRAFT_308230 [Pyronema omphalodes]|nr:hypothetical protein BZA77DRAFT_308230 [Pyronema omphalodes]
MFSTSINLAGLSHKVPSLQHFIQRTRVLSLWRDILRATRKSQGKQELRAWAKSEFVRNKNVQDLDHIKYLISTGRKEFNEMSNYLGY